MKEQICAYIGRELLSGRVAVAPDDALLTSGLLDSLAIIQVVAFIRAELGFAIPPQDVTLENFETVGRIESYLREQKGEG